VRRQPPEQLDASSGNTVTLTLAMSFSSQYVGAKNIYMYAANGAGVNSGWQTRGAWTVSSVSSTLGGGTTSGALPAGVGPRAEVLRLAVVALRRPAPQW
jgi:hypothetical protein